MNFKKKFWICFIIIVSLLMLSLLIQNLFWVVGYNILAIPLTAGVLYKYNIVMPLALGALVISISIIIVAINAQLISYEKYKTKEL